MKKISLTLTLVNKQFMEWRCKRTGQRLGQYLINQLAPKETALEIFYETDPSKAYKLFVKAFVDKS
jgi:hypothetical protein